MQTKALKTVLAALLAMSLVACGGGGDGPSNTAATSTSTGASTGAGTETSANTGTGPNPSPTVSATGLWNKVDNLGAGTRLMVLEGGEVWGLYSNQGQSPFGILQGTVSTSGTSITGSWLDLPLGGSAPSQASVSGTFVPQSTLSLVVNGTTALNMAYEASAVAPATLAQLAGSYTVVAVGGTGSDRSVQMTVATDGTIATTSAAVPGCTGAGQLSLRPSDAAALNFTITFSGSACLFPHGTQLSGVVSVDGDDMVGIGLNATRTQGLLLVAGRLQVS